MVKANDADGMVAGASHATADTLRPALQILKTAPGVKLVSGFFIMDVPEHLPAIHRQDISAGIVHARFLSPPPFYPLTDVSRFLSWNGKALR